MAVETQAVSSPAEEQDPFNGQTPTLREFNSYRVSGEVPARFTPAEAVESAPADTPEETAETEIAPDSESEETQEQPHKVSGAEKRIKQLLAEKKALEAKLAQTVKTDVPPASSPAPQAQQAQPGRQKPSIGDQNPDGSAKFATYEDFVEDLADWKAEQRLENARQQQVQQQQTEKIKESVEDARKRYGDEFESVIEPTAATIMGNKSIPVEVKKMMADSDVLPELVYTIGTDQKTMKELERLARTNPSQAIRYIATLEVGIRQELAKAEPSEGTAAPEPKKTSAPKPPSPVTGSSSRAFDVSDESLSPDDWARRRNAQLARRGHS